MKLFLRSVLLSAAALLAGSMSYAQLTGTVTVPSAAYPDLASVVMALNIQGVGAGGATINLTAGNAQTAPVGGYLLGSATLNATLGATNTLTINGNNNTITANTGTGASDGIFILSGVDYVSINALNLAEAAANTSATTQMERGYMLAKLNTTAPFDGCRNVSITNCTISLNATNSASTGIYGAHINSSGTTLSTTGATGADANSYNTFSGNTITGVTRGIYLTGISTGAAAYDKANVIGGSTTSAGNTITIGGSTNTSYGIYVGYDSVITIQNNNLSIATGQNAATYEIQTATGVGNFNIINNMMNVSCSMPTAYVYGFYNSSGHSDVGSVSTITGNTVTGNNTAATTGYLYGIYNYYNYCLTQVFSDNKAININWGASTGYLYLMYDYYPGATNMTVNNNVIINIYKFNTSTATSYIYGLYIYNYNATTGAMTFTNNKVKNIKSSAYYNYLVYGYAGYASTGGQKLTSKFNRVDSVDNTASGYSYVYSYMGYYGRDSSEVTNDTVTNIVGNNPSGGSVTNYFGYFFYGQNASKSKNNYVNNITTNLQSVANYMGYYVALSDSNMISNISTTNGGVSNYLSYYGTNPEAKNNTVNNVAISGTGALYNYMGYYGTGFKVHNNTINNLTVGTGTCYAQYLYSTSGVIDSFYNNNISSISTTGISNTVYMLYAGGTADVALYNNFISGLNASSAYAGTGLYGIYLASGPNFKAYHNTIYLQPVGSATTFGVTGIYYPNSTSGSLDLRNNIINVNATPAGTGTVVALRRASGTAGVVPSNYALASNGNILYTPTATNSYLYGEGTTTALVNAFNLTNDPSFNTPCGLYKSFMQGRDNATFTENNLVAGTLPNTYAPSGASYAKSGGVATTSPAVTFDYAGTTRGTPPDAGALQFTGTPIDGAGPTIVYTTLPTPSYCTTAPTLTATITDVSGVNTTTGTAPRIYYKKSTDANVFGVANNSTGNGWKWVEATNTGSTFTFAIDYNLLQSAVAAGDIIQYFVVAQDLSASTNVGTVTALYATGFCPSSVSLPAAAGPISATPAVNSYTITAPPSFVANATQSTLCVSGTTTLSVAPVPSGLTVQWQQDNGTGTFVNIPGATGATYTTATLTSTNNYKAVLSCGGTVIFTTPAKTINVNSPAILSSTPATRCGIGTVTLSATGTTGSALNWYAAASGGVSLGTGGTFTTPQIGSTTNYYVGASNIGGSAIATVGTGTTINSTTAYPSPYGQFYGANHEQYIILASELTALGIPAGNITSIAFNLQTGYTYAALSNYAISMGNTSASTASTTLICSPLTTVYSAATYTPPTTTGFTTLNFTTPFSWNGTSNVVVDVSFSNCSVCSITGCTTSFTSNGVVYQSTTPFVSTVNYHADYNCTINTCTPSITGTTYSQRPNMQFGYTGICESPRTLVTATITPAPAITASSPNFPGICSGSTATLNVTSANLSYSYSWTPAATLSCATCASTGATPTTTTTYVVTATDNSGGTSNGCVAKDSVKLFVNPQPAPPTITPATSTICLGSQVTLTSSGTALQGTNWLNVTGLYKNAALTQALTTSDTNKVVYASPLNTQYYTAVTNLQGCLSNPSLSAAVNVNMPPNAAITANPGTSICPGSTTTLTAAQTGTGYTYQWYSSGTAIAGATGNTFTTGTIGSYTVMVTNTVTGCTATTATPTVITVNPPPTATATAQGATTFCNGGTVQITANSGVGYTYQWLNNGSPITGQTAQSFYATATGNYAVIVTTSGGCFATSNAVAVTVNTTPAVVTPQGTTTFCTGYNVVLQANTGASLTYVWQMNGSTISGQTGSSYTATASGSYTVIVTNTATGCTSTSSPVTVTVGAPPTSNITPAGAVAVCDGNSLTLSTNPAPGLSYQWYKNGVAIAGANGQTYTQVFTTAGGGGSYTVNVSSGTGCSSTSAPTIVTVNPQPTVSITAATATTFCQGDNVVLTATTTAGLTYQWYNGATAITGATASTYSATAAGSYTVRGTNSNGCTGASNAITVTVNPLPTVSAAASGATTFCQGGSVVLNATPSAGLSYQWNMNTTPIAGATASSYTAIASGNYTVTATNSNGCANTSNAITVTANPSPNVTTTPAGTINICSGTTTIISIPAGANQTYQWMIGGVNISGATTNTYTTGTAGVYTVKATNTATGCFATSAPDTVIVNPLPTATATAQGPTTICQGDTTILAANAGTGYTYQWRLNGNNIVGATGQTYGATAAGTYTVRVSNSFGCFTISNGITIMVNPAPLAYITYNAPLSFCQGGAVVLNANTGAGLTYQWLLNGVSVGNTSPYNVSSQQGAYTIKVTNSFGCTTTSAPVTVTVWQVPVPLITMNGSILSTGSYATYQWYLNNQPIPGAISQTFAPTANGYYKVVVTDVHQCTATSEQFFVGGLGITTTAGVRDAIKIYPNPATAILHVDAPVAVNLSLRDVSGKVVMVKNGVKELDITNLANGLYLLYISDTEGHLLKAEKVTKTNN